MTGGVYVDTNDLRATLDGNGQPVEPEMPQKNSLRATDPPAPMGPAASSTGGVSRNARLASRARI